ncbi:MAG: hypothetical protein KL787_08660 [Taibaiella sp.]|nr:hypothetical protein [Taibaiella sp.]
MKKIILLGLALLTFAGIHTVSAQDDEEETQERLEKQKLWDSYGNNFIRGYLLRLGDDDNIGIGVEYERIVDKQRKVSIVIPFTYSFGSTDGYNFPSNETSNYFYFNPGLKFYPFGQRKVTYAIGPSLMFGTGKMTGYYDDPNTGIWNYGSMQRTTFGVLANNYLNVQLTQHFCFSADLGLGIAYWTRERYSNIDRTYNIDPRFTASFGLGFGYRF